MPHDTATKLTADEAQQMKQTLLAVAIAGAGAGRFANLSDLARDLSAAFKVVNEATALESADSSAGSAT